MRTGSAPDIQCRRIRQVLRLLNGDDATEADLARIGRHDIPAHIAPHCGIYAINACDKTRHYIIAVVEVQAYPGRLIGQTYQTMTQAYAFCRHRADKDTLKSGAVEGYVWRTNFPPIPLSNRMRPYGLTIFPAPHGHRWQFICDARQINVKALQEAGRITADRDPGPDFSKLSVLLEDLQG